MTIVTTKSTFLNCLYCFWLAKQLDIPRKIEMHSILINDDDSILQYSINIKISVFFFGLTLMVTLNTVSVTLNENALFKCVTSV